MANPQKLEFALNKPTIVSFSGPIPAAEGEGRFGKWSLYNVVSDGTEYSLFPSKGLMAELAPYLERGVYTVIIEKSAKQGTKGLITTWSVADPTTSSKPIEPTPVQKFEAELNQSTQKSMQDKKEQSITRSVALKAGCEVFGYLLANNKIDAPQQSASETVMNLAGVFEDWLNR